MEKFKDLKNYESYVVLGTIILGIFIGALGFFLIQYSMVLWFFSITLLIISWITHSVGKIKEEIKKDIVSEIEKIGEITLLTDLNDFYDTIKKMIENGTNFYFFGFPINILPQDFQKSLRVDVFSGEADVHYFTQVNQENKDTVSEDFEFLKSRHRNVFALQDLSRLGILVVNKPDRIETLITIPTATLGASTSIVGFFSANQEFGSCMINYIHNQIIPSQHQPGPLNITNINTITRILSHLEETNRNWEEISRGISLILDEIYKTATAWVGETQNSIKAVSNVDIKKWNNDPTMMNFFNAQIKSNLQNQRRIFVINQSDLLDSEIKDILRDHLESRIIKIRLIYKDDQRILNQFDERDFNDFILFDNDRGIILERRNTIPSATIRARAFIDSSDYLRPYHERFDKLWRNSQIITKEDLSKR